MYRQRIHTRRNFFFLLCLPLLVCCTQEEYQNNEQAPDQGDIRFEIGIAVPDEDTRTATEADFTTAFTDGDEIGVFAIRRAPGSTGTALDLKTDGSNYFNNVKLTYVEATDTWTPANDLWFPAGSVLDFYAYYPYDATVTDPTQIAFSVKPDQSTAAAYNASDLLTARSNQSGTGYAKGETVTLTFAHALALVQATVPAGTMSGSGPSDLLTITLCSVKAHAVVDLSTGTATPSADNNPLTTIKMYRVEQPTDGNYLTSYTYRALVPAQEVTTGKKLFVLAQDRNLFQSTALAGELILTAGKVEEREETLPFTIHSVRIAKGTFQMGSPTSEPNRVDWETQHQVTLTRDFYMSKYEITNAQYAAFLNANQIGSDGIWATGPYPGERLIYPSNIMIDGDWGLHYNSTLNQWEPVSNYANHPVIWVTWYGAKAFAQWAGAALPTEAQWEYACRAGTTTAYSFGENASDLGNYAWYTTNAGNTTHAVGGKAANPWGLYDMHGNVLEWCEDQWDGSNNYSSLPDTDPICTLGISRVLRGGSWGHSACRSAYRSSGAPGGTSNFIGFRVVFVP